MPTLRHDIVGELFRERPAFAAEILRLAGVPMPRFDLARSESIDFSSVKTGSYSADAAVSFRVHRRPAVPHHPEPPPPPPGRGKARPRKPPDPDPAVLGGLLESQLREDEEKWDSWPIYVTTYRVQIHAPVALVVLCATDDVAKWARQPIDVGWPGFTLRPLAIGPSDLPMITDPAVAALHPEMAVLSARAYGSGRHAAAVFSAVLAALRTVDPLHARMYYDLVLDGLAPSARDLLKELTTVTAVVRNDPRAEVLRQWVEQTWAEVDAAHAQIDAAHAQIDAAHAQIDAERAQLEAEHAQIEAEHAQIATEHAQIEAEAAKIEAERIKSAKVAAHAVVNLLDARGVELSATERERITTCTDADHLGRWGHRAPTVTSADELFR